MRKFGETFVSSLSFVTSMNPFGGDVDRIAFQRRLRIEADLILVEHALAHLGARHHDERGKIRDGAARRGFSLSADTRRA